MTRKVVATVCTFVLVLTLTSVVPSAGILDSPSSPTHDLSPLLRPPPDAYLVIQGFVYEADGSTPALNCSVNVTNKNTGAWGLTTTDSTYGFYSFDTESYGTPPDYDDVINVTATKGMWIGRNETVVGSAFVTLWIDVTLSRASHIINLTMGWNFISLPLVGGGYRASTLGLLPGDVVVGFDSSTQRYNRSYTVAQSPPLKDFWILPSEGYWVYSATARTLSIEGSVPNGTQSRTIYVPPTGGWFTFGLASLKTTYKASNVPSWYSPLGSVSAVARYLPGTNYNVSVWIPGGPFFKDFFLVPGQAYWIWVTCSGTLSYSS